jgi:hypothetical protein
MPATKSSTTGPVEMGVTLADGTELVVQRPSKPRFWRSWLMQQAPYGTDWFGSHSWYVKRIVEPSTDPVSCTHLVRAGHTCDRCGVARV